MVPKIGNRQLAIGNPGVVDYGPFIRMGKRKQKPELEIQCFV